MDANIQVESLEEAKAALSALFQLGYAWGTHCPPSQQSKTIPEFIDRESPEGFKFLVIYDHNKCVGWNRTPTGSPVMSISEFIKAHTKAAQTRVDLGNRLYAIIQNGKVKINEFEFSYEKALELAEAVKNHK